MKNEWIFWALLVIVVVLFSLYLKLNGTQTIGMFVGISNSAGNNTVYPFQKISVPISVMNTGGSTIENLVFGVVVNGNASNSYKLTIPVGKSVNIQYNFTPIAPGVYNITVIADPAQIYQVSNRNSAHNATFITVSAPSNATPYSLLPGGKNVTTSGNLNLGRAGFLASSFIFQTYGIDTFAPTSAKDDFVFSVLNLTQLYIRNISTAYANYKNGDYAYSVWVTGYLQPKTMGIAALGRGYNISNFTLEGRNVTFVPLGNSTTFCSWYQNGWIQSVVYHNSSGSCIGIYNGTISTLKAPLSTKNNTIYNKMAVVNGTLLGNYTSAKGSTSSYSSFSVVGTQFVVPTITLNSTVGKTCYGVIKNISGTNFCSTYILPSSGDLSGIALVRTTAQIGKYNASVFSLINSSNIFQSLPVAIGLIKSLNLTGNASSFNSGFANACDFNNSFGCTSTNFLNGTLTLNVTNDLNSNVRINSLYCRTSGNVTTTSVNKTLGPFGAATLNVTCYQHGKVISGIPLNLKLSLLLNYTIGNSTITVPGNATVNVFTSS